jgi:hypothetical protein
MADIIMMGPDLAREDTNVPTTPKKGCSRRPAQESGRRTKMSSKRRLAHPKAALSKQQVVVSPKSVADDA